MSTDDQSKLEDTTFIDEQFVPIGGGEDAKRITPREALGNITDPATDAEVEATLANFLDALRKT